MRLMGVSRPRLNITREGAWVLLLVGWLTIGGVYPAPQPVQAAAPPLPPGNPALGKALFTGALRFQKGGPPCMTCHRIAGIGALGGGTLGPDLTPVYYKYGGEAGLASFGVTLPLPTMLAVWGTHPLTREEQAHLIAFLRQASAAGRPIQATGQLVGLALFGTVILLVAAQLLWWRRLTEVRRPMVLRHTSRIW